VITAVISDAAISAFTRAFDALSGDPESG
jgi:hypothetical protein